jgi:hypothetical protein
MITEKIQASDRASRVARAITRFVQNPLTNLVKGGVLVVIGLFDTSVTIRDDVAHGHLRLGHGLIIIGLFSILDALPNLIEGMEAWARYLEHREKKEPVRKESDSP